MLLLLITLTVVLLFFSGVDSIIESASAYQWIGILVLLISSSYILIDKEDIIIMERYLTKLFKTKKC